MPVDTITLRARVLSSPPVVGGYMASRGGAVVYRVVSFAIVRDTAAPSRDFYRIRAERLKQDDVPRGTIVRPWPGVRNPPPRRMSADPGPPETGKQRLGRIRAKAPILFAMAIAAIRNSRQTDDKSRLARAGRVGEDAGFREGRDLGHGIRLKGVRDRDNTVLRESDVEIEDGPDPNKPNVTVRRARRTDPLAVMLRGNTLTFRQVDAAEKLRDALEGSEPAVAGAGALSGGVAPWQRSGLSAFQLQSRTTAREAIEAIHEPHRNVVIWMCCGGTLRAYVSYARVHHRKAAEQLTRGLDQLADHFGIEGKRAA